MTTEEQVIAIAEFCGWRWWSYTDTKGYKFHLLHGPTYTDKMGQHQGGKVIKRPDDWSQFASDAPAYAKDLNAIQAAVLMLPDDNSLHGLVAYCNTLANICGSHRACVAAEAPQRLEALCRTLWPERWKE